MVGISRVFVPIAVATQEVRVPVSLVAGLLSTQSNPGRAICNRNQGEIEKCGNGMHFGIEERKKTNVDVENEAFDVAVPRANNSCSVLVCYGRVGGRAKRPVFSRLKYLFSCLN